MSRKNYGKQRENMNKRIDQYKLEQLEPRLMMDGNQWGNEIQSSVYYAVGSASLGVAAQGNCRGVETGFACQFVSFQVFA